MFNHSGTTTLITGASTGIGEQFARQLAARGSHLILVARSEDKLRALVQELGQRHGVRAEYVVADLSVPGAAQRVLEQVKSWGRSVDVLVNNAGFATYGRFEQLSLSRQREEIALNVSALVELTYLFLPDVIQRQGGVINVASTASFQPVPYMAIYGATKAFVLSFSEALWAELRPRGVRVLALCPGATETPFFEVVAAQEASVGKRATPESLVQFGLKAFGAKRPSAIHGFGNALLSLLSRFTPRATTVRIAENMMKPRQEVSATGASGVAL